MGVLIQIVPTVLTVLLMLAPSRIIKTVEPIVVSESSGEYSSFNNIMPSIMKPANKNMPDPSPNGTAEAPRLTNGNSNNSSQPTSNNPSTRNKSTGTNFTTNDDMYSSAAGAYNAHATSQQQPYSQYSQQQRQYSQYSQQPRSEYSEYSAHDSGY